MNFQLHKRSYDKFKNAKHNNMGHIFWKSTTFINTITTLRNQGIYLNYIFTLRL
jgi:hypothetical protein